MMSRGTGYEDEPKKPVRDLITEVSCDNFTDYSSYIDSLRRKGFSMPRAPIRLNSMTRKDLQKLADEGNEVVAISHFDSDGHRIDDLFEVHAKPYNK